MQKYFHVGSKLRLIHFEYFQEKTLHVEENKVPKANLKCSCRFTRLLNLDTVRMMSRTNSEPRKSHPKAEDDIKFSADCFHR